MLGPHRRELDKARSWGRQSGAGGDRMPRDQIEQLILRVSVGIQPVDEEGDFEFRLHRVDRLYEDTGASASLRKSTQNRTSLAISSPLI